MAVLSLTTQRYYNSTNLVKYLFSIVIRETGLHGITKTNFKSPRSLDMRNLITNSIIIDFSKSLNAKITTQY